MARASALHAEGQGFDSLILHQRREYETDESTIVRQVRENKKIKGKKSTRLKITTHSVHTIYWKVNSEKAEKFGA